MQRPKLITNVADIGLLHGLAQTRGRLAASAVVATGVMVGVGLLSAHYVLEVSDSVGLNLLLITLNMMVLFVATYLQTILVGDLTFPGPWREQVILGKSAEVASMRNHNAELTALLVIFGVANALLINMAAGGFFDTYREEGFYRARLRSDSAAERVAALEYMTNVKNFGKWDHEGLRSLVLEHFGDPDLEVRRIAVWNAGRMDITSSRAALVAIVEDAAEDEILRAEAAEAIGALGIDNASRVALEAVLTGCAAECSPRLQVGILRGLALMRSPLSIPIASEMTRSPDEQVALHAFWVLRNTGEVGLREQIHEQLKATDPTSLRQCALLDTLKMVATKEDVAWARRQFDRADPEAKCEPVIWTERNDRQHYVLYSDGFREKYLKIVANAAGSEQRAWYQRLIADPEQPWRVREVAQEIMKQLDEASGRR